MPQVAGGCQSYSYQSVKSILKNGLDRQALLEEAVQDPVIEHGNVRGADYYASGQSEEVSPC